MKKEYEKAFIKFISFNNVDILDVSNGIKKDTENTNVNSDSTEGEWDILTK